LLGARRTARLVRDFAGLHHKPKSGFTSCFFDDPRVFAYLTYPDDHEVTVDVGCGGVSNGNVIRTGTAGPDQLDRDLHRWVGW
jgi:hypothetical protein